MNIQIVEIIGRATQGITKPFICRGDDGYIYFVKGRGAGNRSLICEWIAGNLALKLGLPIAPFEIVDVPEMLIQLGMRDDLGDLGAGLAFGSRKLEVVELSISHLQYVPDQLQRDVLVFDWWVHNIDRTLSEMGGNPNLFWDVENEQLVVIDHNQAFDAGFSVESFINLHAFHEQIHNLCADWVLQHQYAHRLANALSDWDIICNTVPLEWWFVDPEQTIPTDFDRDVMHRLLLRCQNNAFWKMK
ncbi:MAG: hypothetical protein P4L77_02360 [Sulfuriferula sp.]|nr:hypothetical protein [Sulfuriferula sp.]